MSKVMEHRHDPDQPRRARIAGDITPTDEERRWMHRAAKVLADCPPGLVLWTVGDMSLHVSRAGMMLDEDVDMSVAETRAAAGVGTIPCATHIHSAAG